jgi:hypothetical protein
VRTVMRLMIGGVRHRSSILGSCAGVEWSAARFGKPAIAVRRDKAT